MGPFGASHYFLSFFSPFHSKLPPSKDAVLRETARLAGAWKALGLTYFLLKGLKRTSKSLKLIGDTAERYSNKDDVPKTGKSGTFGIDKGACRSLRATNHVRSHPVTSQNTAGYKLRKLSQTSGQISSPTRACESNTSRICRGAQKDTFTDSLQHFSANTLCEAATSSSEESRLSTKKSLKRFGLGLEGVMTTITGLPQRAHSKNEVKEIITVVKTVDGVVEGVKAAKKVIHTFTSPVGDVLHALGAGGDGVIIGFNTAKVVLKGVKISKGLITVTKWCNNKHIGVIGAATDIVSKVDKSIHGKRFKTVVKGLKASEAAAVIVSMAKEVGKTPGMLDKVDQLLSWSLILKGFKFTKSAIRVLEPLQSLPLGAISALGKGMLEIKGALEGFSAVVKAFSLSKELYMVLLKGIGFTQGAIASFNGFHWRLFLHKRSEEEYSQSTEVSFKGLCYNQQLAIPSIIWSLSEAENKRLGNRWEFIEHSNPTMDDSFLIRVPEIFGEFEDNSPLPLSFLRLASCFNSEQWLEIPTESG